MKLIEMGKNKKELAKELNVNYTQLCNSLSGYVNNETMENRICEHLGIVR